MKANWYKTYDADILIVGGGGAAAMAALEATRNGVKPLIMCKDTFIGGATVQASGGTSIPFLPEDSPAIFFDDTMKSGARINNKRLVKVLTEEAHDVFYGLEQYGFLLDRGPTGEMRAFKRSEGHTFLRSYADRRQFHGIVGGLKRAVIQKKIGLFEERMLVKLLTDEGTVRGGLFFSLADGAFESVSARVVVLVTGGCGQLYSTSTNAQCLTGDGYALAFDAGAELVDMEMVQFLPLAFPRPSTMRGQLIGMCSLFGPNVKLYNGLGERYMLRHDPEKLEYATRDVVARANYTEIQEGRGTRRKTIVVDPTENDRSLVEQYRNSLAVAYDMIAETFGEKAARWEATFEAIPSQHFMMGGVRIDEHCRTSVENLLCCGEVSGGVHGANRLAGNALTEILVFGKRAGKEAAEIARKTSVRQINPGLLRAAVRQTQAYLNSNDGAPPGVLRQRLQKLMWDKVGIVRSGSDLEEALKRLGRLKRMVDGASARCRLRHWNRELLEALELRLMVKTAELIALSARERTESRGSHYRRDFPETDPAWCKNIILSKNLEDGIRVRISRPEGKET
jgi:fumarate reductase (CoM/CoB) subunit A